MTVETDEEYAGVMLRPLAVEPLPSPDVDIERAIVAGRRGKRRRRALAGVAVVAAGALTVTAAVGIIRSDGAGTDPSVAADVTATGATPGPVSCRIERLAVPGGDHPVRVTGMDPTGRFVLGQVLPTNNVDFDLPTLIWDNGQLTSVHLPGTQQELSDITTSGLAIGTYYQGGQPRPVVVRGGQVTALTGVYAGQAMAINDAGTIVGGNIRSAGAAPVPVRWDSPTSQAVNLPLPAGFPYGFATGITEDGTIVGVVNNDRGESRPYVWLPGGAARELPTPTGAAGAIPNAVGGDWATGSGPATDGAGEVQMGVVWNLRTGEATALPGFRARSVGSNGWLVGVDTTRHPGAALVAEGRTVPLPALAELSNDATNVVVAINNDGRVLAGQSDASAAPDTTKPVLWHCGR
jgi:hypothetical protein